MRWFLVGSLACLAAFVGCGTVDVAHPDGNGNADSMGAWENDSGVGGVPDDGAAEGSGAGGHGGNGGTAGAGGTRDAGEGVDAIYPTCKYVAPLAWFVDSGAGYATECRDQVGKVLSGCVADGRVCR